MPQPTVAISPTNFQPREDNVRSLECAVCLSPFASDTCADFMWYVFGTAVFLSSK